MQVSFSAPSLAPSPFASAAPAELASGSPADSFSSLLDSQSGRAPLPVPAATAPAAKIVNTGNTPTVPEPLDEADLTTADEAVADGGSDTESPGPAVAEMALDWSQLADVATAVKQQISAPAPLQAMAQPLVQPQTNSVEAEPVQPGAASPDASSTTTNGVPTAVVLPRASESAVSVLPGQGTGRDRTKRVLPATQTPAVAAAPDVATPETPRRVEVPTLPAARQALAAAPAPVAVVPVVPDATAAKASDTPIAAVSVLPEAPTPTSPPLDSSRNVRVSAPVRVTTPSSQLPAVAGAAAGVPAEIPMAASTGVPASMLAPVPSLVPAPEPRPLVLEAAPVVATPVVTPSQQSDTPAPASSAPAAVAATTPPSLFAPVRPGDYSGVPVEADASPDSILSFARVPAAASGQAPVATAPVHRGQVAPSWRVTEQARATGAQIIMENASTASPNAALSRGGPVDAASAAAAVSRPIVSMQTLAQMLVETAAVNMPRPVTPRTDVGLVGGSPSLVATATPAQSAPQVAAVPAAETPVVAASVVPANVAVSSSSAGTTVPMPPRAPDTTPLSPLSTATPVSSDSDAPAIAADEQPMDTSVRGLREILAANVGKSGRRESSVRKEGPAQNFQTVEKQRVGGAELEIGTRIANRTQTMTAPAPVQLPADAALDTFESPSAAAQAVSTTSGNTALKPTAEVAAPRSFAAAVVREVMDVAEKAQATGRTHVELKLETKDNESLRIHLNWRDGVVHAKFVTQTSELQRALSREWDQVAPRLAEQGLKFSEPSFERNGQPSDQQSAHSTFSSDQQRQQSRGRNADADDLPEFALPGAAPKTAAVSTRQVATRTSATPSPALADARGLRVWA